MTVPPAPTKRLVLLTGAGPQHRYVANQLSAVLPLEAIVVDSSTRRRSLRRAFRGGFRHGVSRLALDVMRRAVKDRGAAAAAVTKVLGDEATQAFTQADRVVRVDGINSAEALAVVASHQPDALLVYGTAIVRDQMLALAGDLAFNMHTGMSPHYRGTDCAFWPVANREPELIGATVHECTARADAGPIYAVAPADWQPDDDLHALFARSVVIGAELYADTVQRYLDGELDGTVQDLSIGREYRGYMRTLIPELRARWALRRGLLRKRPGAVAADPSVAR